VHPRRRSITAAGELAVTALAALVLGACASTEPVPDAPYTRNATVDFSGSWEIDYARSDDAERRLRTTLLQLTKSPDPYSVRVDPAIGGARVAPPSEGSLNAVVALAQLAEEITRPQVLEIDQSVEEIEIDRGDETFALTCALFADRPEYEEGVLATELCGWDEDRLVFRASLPDGLSINHRFTLSPDGEQLHVATTLSAPGAAAVFTLNRFYNRFEPLPGRDGCRETLTRGRVCEYGAR
jgi:hypothetical protein